MGKTKPRKRSVMRNRAIGVPRQEETSMKSLSDEKNSLKLHVAPLLEKVHMSIKMEVENVNWLL